MVCKEDVVSWFKELESYKRIDAMCTLLNMCLPFELRFIGTYLEELGKRDFQELRGAELRANNPNDLAADISGANTDPRTRRKMALYVSLLRSCNFACATTLYNVMVSLEQSGLFKGLYGDLLEEILLLYTMALHHPAFTFDQKSHFGDILDKLKVDEHKVQQLNESEHNILNILPVSVSHSSLAPNLSVPPPNLPLPGLVFVKSPPLQQPAPHHSSSDQIPELATTPLNLPVPIPTSSNMLPVLADVHHPPPGLPLPQFNMGDYVIGQTPWPTGLIMSPINQPIEPPVNYPPSASPCASSGESRGPSPTGRRRSPPHHHHLTATFENLTVAEMRRMDDERLHELGVPANAVSQLRSVEKLNGVRRRRASSDSSSSSSGGAGGGGSTTGGAPPAQYPVIFSRAFPGPYGGYGPPSFAGVANGEAPPYPATYSGFVPVMFAPPKLSCWNCGASGHAGHECKEPSMEEMTRAGGYQLDYAPPDSAPDK